LWWASARTGGHRRGTANPNAHQSIADPPGRSLALANGNEHTVAGIHAGTDTHANNGLAASDGYWYALAHNHPSTVANTADTSANDGNAFSYQPAGTNACATTFFAYQPPPARAVAASCAAQR
jgi:hypothetical protein